MTLSNFGDLNYQVYRLIRSSRNYRVNLWLSFDDWCLRCFHLHAINVTKCNKYVKRFHILFIVIHFLFIVNVDVNIFE